MDVGDDLFALLEGGAPPSMEKTSQGKSPSKRKRPLSKETISDESDMDMSSGDDEVAPASKRLLKGGSRAGADGEGVRYPVEGQYTDEAERDRVQQMTEFEREAFLSERADQQTEAANRAGVRRMVEEKERKDRGVGSSDEEEDEGTKKGRRTGRDRQTTGTTTASSRALDKLKKKRAAKGSKKSAKDDRSSDRAASDDDDDADGGYGSKNDSDDDYEGDRKSSKRGGDKSERETRGGKGKGSSAKKSNGVEGIDSKEFAELMVTRDKLMSFSRAPWFGEWIKGGWVRLFVGPHEETRQPMYRICRVEGISRDPTRKYEFEGSLYDIWLTLRHADAVRDFTMSVISNSPFSDQEFDRLSATLKKANLSLPDAKAHKATKKRLDSQTSYVLTSADLNEALAKKESVRGGSLNPAMGKARLTIKRDYAASIGDEAGVEAANEAIASYDLRRTGSYPSLSDLAQSSTKSSTGANDVGGIAGGRVTEAERMALVNERNRAANREDIRKAEGKNQEERRKLAAALKRGDVDVKVDPSARVKTMTRLKYDRDEVSRPTTPLVGSPIAAVSADASGATTPVLPVIPRPKTNQFEAMLAKVELDVDLDF